MSTTIATWRSSAAARSVMVSSKSRPSLKPFNSQKTKTCERKDWRRSTLRRGNWAPALLLQFRYLRARVQQLMQKIFCIIEALLCQVSQDLFCTVKGERVYLNTALVQLHEL